MFLVSFAAVLANALPALNEGYVPIAQSTSSHREINFDELEAPGWTFRPFFDFALRAADADYQGSFTFKRTMSHPIDGSNTWTVDFSEDHVTSSQRGVRCTISVRNDQKGVSPSPNPLSLTYGTFDPHKIPGYLEKQSVVAAVYTAAAKAVVGNLHVKWTLSGDKLKAAWTPARGPSRITFTYSGYRFELNRL